MASILRGLVRKASLGKVDHDSMDIVTEVRSVFVKAMGGKHDFPFLFLQPTGAGSRRLSMPAMSALFQWCAQQVAKLGTNKQTIILYIIATDELELVSAVPKCYMCMENNKLHYAHMYI